MDVEQKIKNLESDVNDLFLLYETLEDNVLNNKPDETVCPEWIYHELFAIISHWEDKHDISLDFKERTKLIKKLSKFCLSLV